MHGSIDSSRHDELVITEEDYEDFFETRMAIAQRLSSDLLAKSFLSSAIHIEIRTFGTLLLKLGDSQIERPVLTSS